MDTNKYRLPDHANGNGTKAQLDTRQSHLERHVSPPSPAESPPLPPPKDDVFLPGTAAAAAAAGPGMHHSTDFVPGLSSYFTPGHQRPGSIYTLSRASFADQLAQLTSLQLPDAESLSSKLSAIPSAHIATTALINAADQIKSWICKASEVIDGLDSDDDVEWAAAAGREGLAEVEKAISRFERLIKVYVSAVEELHCRRDITAVAPDDLRRAVSQMEGIAADWSSIHSALQSVKGQVEIAMEWEELWNVVLGDIQNEKDELCRLVFEMEERRHRSLVVAAAAAAEGIVDINDLESIVGEPPLGTRALRPAPTNNRFSLPAPPLSPMSSPNSAMSPDDSSLLALFARMQPLRASLDFLPMRLSVFLARAGATFPTACEELETRQAGLDVAYKKLEDDAESLRKELGEDRWVLVFRGAGRQAQKMCESVERSAAKVREGIDMGLSLTNPAVMGKKMENYEAKKMHYGPAIERVIGIIDKGVKDRLTVNGEVLRLHGEMQARWAALREQLSEIDVMLDELHSERRGQQLRDSVSSMLSNDRSTIASAGETPASSPPSSVIMQGGTGADPATPSAKIGAGAMPPEPSSVGRSGSRLPQPSRGCLSPSSSRIPQLLRSPTPGLGKEQAKDPGRNKHSRAWNPYWNSTSADGGTTSAAGRSGSSPTPASFEAESKQNLLASPADPEDTPSKRAASRLSLHERSRPAPQGLARVRLAAASTLEGARRASSFQPLAEESTKPPSQPSVRSASSLSFSGGRGQALAGARHAMRTSSTSDKPRWRF